MSLSLCQGLSEFRKFFLAKILQNDIFCWDPLGKHLVELNELKNMKTNLLQGLCSLDLAVMSAMSNNVISFPVLVEVHLARLDVLFQQGAELFYLLLSTCAASLL